MSRDRSNRTAIRAAAAQRDSALLLAFGAMSLPLLAGLLLLISP